MSHVPEDVKKKLLDYPFVTAVGTAQGRGERHENDEKAAVAFVVEKKEESELDEEEVLPKEINGWKVDVQEVGEIGIEEVVPQSPKDTGDIDTTERHRPAPQGVSAAHRDTTAGTDGFVGWEGVERFSVTVPAPRSVSNKHVYAPGSDAEVGDFILQPGPHDGGEMDRDIIGTLKGYVELESEGNTVDVAWSSIEGRKLNSYIPSIGVPTETAEVTEGDTVKKFGRTTGLREGEVRSTDARIRVRYSDGVKEFEDQILASDMSAGGDSGSAVVNEDGDLVGLLFAGSDSVTVVNKISNVLEETGLHLNPEEVYN